MGLIDSSGFEQENKRWTEDCTRKRKLPFREPVWFMLTMTKTSVQNALEDFMAKVREDIPITQQAFSGHGKRYDGKRLRRRWRRPCGGAMRIRISNGIGFG